MAEPISPPSAPRTARSALTVGVSLFAWSLGAYVFYLLAGRILGPTDYGLAAALQAAIVVVSIPLVALQWALARVTAAHWPTQPSGVVAVFRRGLTLGMCIGIGVATLATLGTLLAATHSSSIPTGALIVTYWSVLPLIPLALVLGILQGRERYIGLAWTYALTGILRGPFLLPLLLIPFLAPVEGTSLATGLAILVGAIVGWIAIKKERRLPAGSPGKVWPSFTRGLPATLAGLAGIAALSNIDVIAAKVNLGGATAGYFGATALAAKALLIAPQAMAVILLPRVAKREADGQATGPLLAMGVLAVVALGVIAIALAAVFAEPVITITFGSAYAPAADLLVPFLGATTVLGALLILVNHHVARGDFPFVWAVGGLAVVQITLLIAFAHSGLEVITIDAAVAACGLVLHEIIYWGKPDSMLFSITAVLRGHR